VPRHLFIDEALASRAYENTALPIGCGQTISQPWVVARMSEVLLAGANFRAGKGRVLEIGTGSGYQAAVLSDLVEQVYSVERIDELLRPTRRRLRKIGYENIRLRHDDGRIGWPDVGPFDGILVTAATARIEQALLDQLAVGGRLIAPVGPSAQQELICYEQGEDGISETRLGPVLFVPLLGGVL
jgi:protein-L-isoaspartate(D-aspartate) O-methyltransferase